MHSQGNLVKLPRRQFLHLTAGDAALPAASRIARAQAYPTRPVRIFVGFPASATPELVALAPDVILVSSGSALAALQNATRTVPIVFVNVTDPVDGVRSLRRCQKGRR